MEKPLTLTLLYTANIRGDIHMLPRLYTFMQTLKPTERQGTLIFDLGNSCADEVWHCAITQGRSTLIVLDGMGYHAVNVVDSLDTTYREKIADRVTMGLVDDSHTWRYHIPPVTDETIQATLNPSELSCRLQICLSPTESTHIEDNTLYLADIPAKYIGIVNIDLSDSPIITHQDVQELPADTPPNPTIVASVEFVESEARYFQKKQTGEI
jgi:hypothetical protein